MLHHFPGQAFDRGPQQLHEPVLRGAAAHQLGGEGGPIAVSGHEAQQLSDAFQLGLQQVQTEHQVRGYAALVDAVMGLIQSSGTLGPAVLPGQAGLGVQRTLAPFPYGPGQIEEGGIGIAALGIQGQEIP